MRCVWLSVLSVCESRFSAAYQPSLPSAVALTLLSILGAGAVVVGYFLLFGAAIGLTGYAIAKSAAVNRLEGGRARHGYDPNRGAYLRSHHE